MPSRTASDQTPQMGLPNSRPQSFAAKLPAGMFTGWAELPLNLGRPINSLLHLCLFTTHCIQFLLHRLDARREAFCRGGQTLTRVPFAFRLPLQAVHERALPDVQHSFG